MEHSVRRMAMLLAFPGLFLALFLTERLATHALALYPASPFLWRASLELRGLYGEFSNRLDLLSGYTLWIQIVFICALFLSLFLVAQTKRGPAVCFLANHVLVLAGAFATLIANNFMVASFDVAGSTPDSVFFTLDFHLNLPQVVVLATGIAGSLYSHVVVLSAARRDQKIRA